MKLYKNVCFLIFRLFFPSSIWFWAKNFSARATRPHPSGVVARSPLLSPPAVAWLSDLPRPAPSQKASLSPPCGVAVRPCQLPDPTMARPKVTAMGANPHPRSQACWRNGCASQLANTTCCRNGCVKIPPKHKYSKECVNLSKNSVRYVVVRRQLFIVLASWDAHPTRQHVVFTTLDVSQPPTTHHAVWIVIERLLEFACTCIFDADP